METKPPFLLLQPRAYPKITSLANPHHSQTLPKSIVFWCDHPFTLTNNVKLDNLLTIQITLLRIDRISFIFPEEQADGEYDSVCVGICVFSLVYRTGGAHAGPGDVFTPAFIHQKPWGKKFCPGKKEPAHGTYR